MKELALFQKSGLVSRRESLELFQKDALTRLSRNTKRGYRLSLFATVVGTFRVDYYPIPTPSLLRQSVRACRRQGGDSGTSIQKSGRKLHSMPRPLAYNERNFADQTRRRQRSLQTTWRVRHRRSQRDRESERERERGRGERETIAARHCTARLRACAYASELSFYLISAAAATLSRRLARAALYSLLPSRSDCAPLPPPPRVSLARTRILGLFHFFICFTSSSLPLRLPVPLSSFSLPFFLAPRSPPFLILSPCLSYFSLLPYPPFSPILSLLPPPLSTSFLLSLFLQEFSSNSLCVSTPFSRSPRT